MVTLGWRLALQVFRGERRVASFTLPHLRELELLVYASPTARVA